MVRSASGPAFKRVVVTADEHQDTHKEEGMRPDVPRSTGKILTRKVAAAQRQKQKEEVTSAFKASQRKGTQRGPR